MISTSNSRSELRASDAERERAVEILGQAAIEGRLSVEELDERIQSAYATRTVGGLERLLADISQHAPLDGCIPESPRCNDRIAVRQGPRATRWIVSIMTGSVRRGHWRVAKRCTVLSIMGASEVDLCDVELSHPVTQLNVYSVMGGGVVRVPDGVRVQVSKFALMAGNDVRLGDHQPQLTGPLIRIRLVSIMGGGKVRTGRRPSRTERRRARQLRASRRREEASTERGVAPTSGSGLPCSTSGNEHSVSHCV